SQTDCTTPSTVSLSSPTRIGLPLSPSESMMDGRRHSIGNLSAKSLAALSKKRVTCDMCGKSYCDKGALKIHTSAVHLKEMQMCTVPGCSKEFTSRRSRNRHSKNKNMKLHTNDPAKLAAISAVQEQTRILSGAMLGQPALPVKESRKRKSVESALDLSMHNEVLTQQTALLPTVPNPNMQLLLLQQMMHFFQSQLLAQQQAVVMAAAAAAAASSAPSTAPTQTAPTLRPS
ncbi:hypothetical protein PFISCL1PPCAC_2873, partial [Pristionchus fissidentatus]